MISESQQEQAALYVLGALRAGELEAFETELRRDPNLRTLVSELQPASVALAKSTPSLPLPAGLKSKVFERVITAAESNPDLGANAASQTARPIVEGFSFSAANDPAGWKELPIPGAWIKLLNLQADKGYAVLIGRLKAGVRYPAHTHPGPEEILILTGDLQIGDRTLGPGDFHHADAGTSHPVNYTVAGCELLAVLPADHELVKFATG